MTVAPVEMGGGLKVDGDVVPVERGHMRSEERRYQYQYQLN